MQSYSRKPLIFLILLLALGFIIYKPEIILAASNNNYVEAEGIGKAPVSGQKSDFWKRVAARRGAMADLQRNLLIKAFNINKRNNKVSGVVKGVEVLSGEWDGKFYKLKGRALRRNIKLR
ncbi:MAG: hypothetical protein IJ520_11645 [Synergistaceae bacterium]|nr:hypothetical protein [Synergistaceae bacterium]